MKQRRTIDPTNPPGPKRKPVPFAWIDCNGVTIVLAMDGDGVVVDAPDFVVVSATPHGKIEARRQEVDEQWPVVSAQVFVSRSGRRQRLVIDTNQMSLCRGDVEQAIVEWLARRASHSIQLAFTNSSS